MQDDLSAHQEDRLVWTPDVLGSICFLVSGLLPYRVAARAGHAARRTASGRWPP
jgi:hypothetical protein